MTHGERMVLFDRADLYVVITEAFCAGRTSLEVLSGVLAAGVRLVQLREKDIDGDDDRLLEIARKFRIATSKAGALLIINDHVDVALAVGADGVHLGQDDLAVNAAIERAPELIIGASTHSLDEALAAEAAGASYVNIGPIFDTATKSVPSGAIGPEAIAPIASRLTIPWTVMGGIKPQNIEQVLAEGARHPAVVTAVTAADDVTAAATELRDRIRQVTRDPH
jgi:thiamine-phosphate pyrophosphorylase